MARRIVQMIHPKYHKAGKKGIFGANNNNLIIGSLIMCLVWFNNTAVHVNNSIKIGSEVKGLFF